MEVTKEITPDKYGEVVIFGTHWLASSDKKQKVDTEVVVEKIEGNTVLLKNGETLTTDKVFCAIGRKPILPKTQTSISTDEKGRAKINEKIFSFNFYVLCSSGVCW